MRQGLIMHHSLVSNLESSWLRLPSCKITAIYHHATWIYMYWIYCNVQMKTLEAFKKWRLSKEQLHISFRNLSYQMCVLWLVYQLLLREHLLSSKQSILFSNSSKLGCGNTCQCPGWATHRNKEGRAEHLKMWLS